MSASLIGRLGSSAFRVPTTAVSISLTGSRFSSELAPRPFHYGISRTRWNNLLAGLAVIPTRYTPAQSQQRRCREDNDDNDLPWVEKPHRKDPT